MAFQEIIYEVGDGIALITFNRPHRLNAINPVMGDEFRRAMEMAAADPAVRVLILTGAGKAFCAGWDLERGGDAFDGNARAGDRPGGPRGGARNYVRSYFEFPKPMIAAYNGSVTGVGTSMTMLFDIRIAARSARVGFAFNRRGVLPELALPWLLPKIVGLSRATELMLTGRMVPADEALEWGLVSRVVPDEELLPAARQLAREIIDNCAPVSTALTRRMIYEYLGETDIGRAVEDNQRYFAWSGKQPDAREGIMSFLEKRPPRWSMTVPGHMPEF